METPWRRSIFSIFLMLSLNDIHVFCQNVAPCGPQVQLLTNEANRECPNVNMMPPSPQLMNTLLTVAAANGVLPEMLPTLGPIIPGNPQLQDAICQQQVMLPFNPQGHFIPPGLSQSFELLNSNLILPSPNLPASPPCPSFPPTPITQPPSVSPGLIPQALLPPNQPPANFRNPFLANGIVRPIIPRPSSANLPSTCTDVSESTILEANTVAINPVVTPNAVRSINQPFISPQQQFINQFATNSCPANQNVQSELNLITPLQTNQQIVNQFSGYNCPVQAAPPGVNPSLACNPIITPSFGIFQPNPIISQQPQLLSTPSNILSSETLIETEVNSDVAISNTVNTAITEIQQPAVFAEERSQQMPFNFQINIPPLSLPAPSITLINTPPNIPVAPASAPIVPSFCGYPSIQPVIVEGSRSKLKNWLPIILVALLNDDNGSGCGCCGSCSCSNNIPFPFPIPIPVNNPIINISGKGRKSTKGNADDAEE